MCSLAACARSVFIAYKVFERNLDNTLSSSQATRVRGGTVSYRPAVQWRHAATPLRQRFGEPKIEAIITRRAVFIFSLAAMSYFFGVRGNRSQRRAGERARFSRPSGAVVHWEWLW
jgi:hypothetical protein